MRADYPTGSAPDGVMVFETPLLRVSRPVAACSRCRSAKIKCDGKLPACTACERSNRASECSATNDQFARGKERSYVATLEARVEKMERRLAEARARRNSSLTMMEQDVSLTPRPQAVANPRKIVDNRAARRKEESDINDLVSDFGLLAVNATARDFYGFTSAMSYARLILSAASKEHLPLGLAKNLPPRYQASPLIQHYLNSIFVLLPIFDEASFYASVDAVYNPDIGKASSFDCFTVRMVLAISSMSCSTRHADAHYGNAVGHVAAALTHAESVLHPGSVPSLQALLLLTQYAMMDPYHFDSWHLIGAASRALVDLGMHHDPPKSSPMQKGKIELRRRVYHCLYAMDRETSLVQTRAFSFSDDSAHVGLPFSTQKGSASKTSPKAHAWLQSFDSALDLFRLRQLQSQWYTTLFQSGRHAWEDPYPFIWRTYRSMTAWFSQASPKAVPATREYFELELLYSYVYLLSPSDRCPRINGHAQMLIFEHCIAYASKMLATLENQSQGAKAPITFYDAMRAYMTGRQFVDNLARNQDRLLSLRRSRSPSVQPTNRDDSVDPLSQGSESLPPPIPDAGPLKSPVDPCLRSINAINNFTQILSALGLRFGLFNWRDRFQQESACLLSELTSRSQGLSTGLMPPPEAPDGRRPSFAGSSPITVFGGSPSHPSPEAYGLPSAAGFPQASTDWANLGGPPQRRVYSIGSPAVSPGAPVVGDMGAGVAWETLPGGSLNARFA